MGYQLKLYIIYSSSTFESIYEILLKHAKSPKEIGSLRCDYTRNQKSREYYISNRRFVIMTENVYTELAKAGYADSENKDFYVDEYEIRGENKAPHDSVMHYYFPDYKTHKSTIIERMKFYEGMGLFKSDDYVVHNGVVEFSNRISDYNRIIVKIILDTVDCRVSWCRKNAFARIRHSF